GQRERDGNGLSNALVWTGGIEVAGILGHLEPEVSVAQNEQDIQALAAQAAEEPIAHAIGARRGNGCVQDFDPGTDGNPIEARTIFTVIVANEIAWAFAKGRRLPHLL